MCSKCDEIVDVVREVGFDSVVTETWQAGGISDQNLVGDVAPAGYSFITPACTHRKGGAVGILIRGSLKFEEHSRYPGQPFLFSICRSALMSWVIY